MKLLSFGLLAALVLAIGSWHLHGESPIQPPIQTSPDRLKPFMHQKLEHSKSILEALAIEDYDKMAASAQSLSLLSLESNWKVLTTDEYLNSVTLSGQRKEEKGEKGESFHRIERRSGSFSRTLTLPCDVNEDEVAAEYTNGVLLVKLPKCEKSKPKKISVK